MQHIATFPGIACGPFEKLQVGATFLPPSTPKHLFGIISKELDCSLLDQNTREKKIFVHLAKNGN